MKAVFLFSVGLGFLQIAQALDIPLTGPEKVVISSSDGQWNIRSQAGIKMLRVQGPDIESDFLVEKRDGALVLLQKDLQSTQGLSAKSKKKKVYEVWVPSTTSLDFHNLEGQVTVQKILKESSFHVHRGSLTIRESNAPLSLHLQKGEVLILDSQGKIDLDSQAGKVDIRNFTGDVDLQNFSGESKLEKVKGLINIVSGSGNTQVLASSGTLQFELGRGVFSAQKFMGRIEGQSQEGSMSLALSPDSDLNVKTQAGKVNVQLSPGSSPYLNLGATEGDIFVPAPLKVSREGGTKSVRGRRAGEASKGTVFIRAQEGQITVR